VHTVLRPQSTTIKPTQLDTVTSVISHDLRTWGHDKSRKV